MHMLCAIFGSKVLTFKKYSFFVDTDVIWVSFPDTFLDRKFIEGVFSYVG